MTRPCVLVVAASDSSGGAGIARDVETVAAFGLGSALAVTAVTVQTDEVVRHVAPVDPSLIAEQMHAAFADGRIAAVKIGLLPTADAVAAVVAALREHPHVPVVLDPVLKASSGGALGGPGTAEAMRAALFPLLSLLTPNRPELAALSALPEGPDEAAALAQARALLDAGAAAVLAKGGHAAGALARDHLLRPGQAPLPFDAPRLDAAMRGTGCMLASAIAAGMARGEPLEASIAAAKDFVHTRLRERRPAAG